jgi:hypothetical protein
MVSIRPSAPAPAIVPRPASAAAVNAPFGPAIMPRATAAACPLLEVLEPSLARAAPYIVLAPPPPGVPDVIVP